MKLGVIDLGSNALRFSVYERTEGQPCTLVHKERHLLQLGAEVFKRNELSEKAFKNTIKACISARKSSFRLQVRTVLGVATSAVRDAQNGPQFLSVVAEESGVPLSIISGEEEAHLIGQAVALNGVKGTAPSKAEVKVVLDIGGGSTELSIVRGSEVAGVISLPFGGARLGQELYSLKSARARSARLTQLSKKLRRELYPFLNAQGIGNAPQLLGSSGTVRALLTFIAGGNDATKDSIARTEVSAIRQLLAQCSASDIRNALSKKRTWRATHLLGASMVLDETMQALGCASVVPIKTSLADGIALAYLTRNKRDATSTSNVAAWGTRFCA